MSTFRARRRDLDQQHERPTPPILDRVERANRRALAAGPARRRTARPIHQSRQRRHDTSISRGARRRSRVSAVLLERSPRRRIQVAGQYRCLRSGARNDRPVRRRRPKHQYGHLREEHDGSHQQARLPLPTRPAEHRALDRDGTSLERPALARASPGRASQGHRRRTARRRRRGPAHRGIRRSHRPADGERRVERHRLRPANPSTGAKSSRRRRERPGRRRSIGAAPSNRRQAGSRSRASRFRSVLVSQDVRAVRHRCARWTT